MREFFRSWKTKVGVVTLLVACLFMAGWVRSAGKVELIFFNRTWPGHAIISGGGRFRLLKLGNHTLEFASANPGIKAVIRFQDWSPVFMEGSPTIERFDGDFVESFDESSGRSLPMLFIPYWSIVLPLTAISAWLLLSKPRPAKPPAIETVE